MNTRDKTGDQLVASIRKSKSGAVAQKNATRSATGKPPATRQARVAKTVPAPDAGPARKDAAYSYGRRVWPD